MIMNTNNSIECPVNFTPVNENNVRITALQVFLISLAYLLSGYWTLIALLMLDFLIRSFGLGQFSPLTSLSSLAVRLLKLRNKPIDSAPKLFAARVGTIFSFAILTSHTAFPVAALVLGIALSLFAFLESFVGFCAGCYVYSIGKKFFPAS
jgi:hypothetical protein